MTENLTEIALELNRESRFNGMPRLIFMTDNKAQPRPEDIISKMPPGSMVILRDYDDENRFNLGQALRYVCRQRDIKFFVAGDLSLALILEADGLHLPEYMLDDAEQIKCDHPTLLLSSAAHSEEAVKKASDLNLFAVLLSPIFPTKSHPETFNDDGKIIGIQKLTEIANNYKIAIYALGGINSNTAKKIINSNIAGFAGIRGF